MRLAEPATQRRDQRSWERRRTSLPGRLVWRDARSATRFATVLIRNVSELGAYVECVSGTPIPLHRLVFLQAEREVPGHADLPGALKQGRVLSAVYRVGPPHASTGVPEGYGLRLLVEPRLGRSAAGDAQRAGDPLAHAEASA
jgi:uncharacterized protein (UPF0248 family)